MLQLRNMNETQKEIMMSDAQVCTIEGRAGYGKTTLMMHRIHYLHENGIAYKNMLNLCHDKKDIKMNQFLFQTYFPLSESLPTFTTLYSFCFNIINKYNTLKEIETPKPYRNLSTLISKLNKECFGFELSQDELASLMHTIALCKTTMSERELKEFTLVGRKIDAYYLYTQYEKEKEKRNIMDFEDLLVQAMHILATCKEIKEEYQKNIQYIHVDDTQNLPFMAHMILKTLMSEETHLQYYFDLDQATAKHLAPYPQALQSLESVFSEVSQYRLDTNYRMDQSIDLLARSFFYNEKSDETLETKNHCFKGFQTTADLYQYVLLHAQKKPNDCLIVARNPELFLPLIDLFNQHQITYQMNTSIQAFYKHPIVQDMMNYFALLSNPRNLMAFKDVSVKLKLNFPEKAFTEINELLISRPDMTVYQAAIDSSIRTELKNRLRNWIEALRLGEQLSSIQAIKYIYQELNYQKYVIEKNIAQSSVILNILYTMAVRYDTMEKMNQRLMELQKTQAYSSAAIVLDAAHQLSGQEYEEVILLDCQENYFPKVDTQEEKAYFYRAITRARDRVEFLFAKKYDTTRLRPSPYLLQIYAKESKQEATPSAPSKTKAKYGINSTIKHKVLGEGKIVELDKAMAKVHFNSGEIKMLNLDFCKKNQLLSEE